MRFRLLFSLFLFVLILGRPQTASQAGGIPTPVLKWAYGGCIHGPYCDTGWYASPAVADLDGDGEPEVIWGDYDLYALNGDDGSRQWAGDGDGDRIWPGIAVADLTGDGSLEVIAGRGGDSLTVYGSDGDVLWARNPFGGGEVRTLAVADLETDGQLEVIVGRAGSGATRQVNVYEPDGTVRPGWPARHDGDDGYGWGMYNENVTVADLDGDGLAEIVAPTDTHYITVLDGDGEQLLVNQTLYVNSDHNDNGVVKWAEVGVHVDQEADLRGYAKCGEEHRPNFANVAPAIADLDGDGTLEIIVPGDVYNCELGDPDGDMYYLPWILEIDRTRWNGSGYDWTVLPTPEPGSGPLTQDYEVIENAVVNTVIADLDGDGEQEILFPSYDGRLHAYWLDKTQHGNWPYAVPGSGIRFAGEPIVVDLDNNGQAEVIFTSWPEKHDEWVGQLHILDYQGNLITSLDLPEPALGEEWNGGLAAPTIADIDGDPDLELVIGTSHSGAVAYDLPGSGNARVLWGTGRGSFFRTGVVAPTEPATLFLTAGPPYQVIEAGGSAVYNLSLAGAYGGTVTVTVEAAAELEVGLSETAVTLPAEVVLTLTDTHPVGPLRPGVWYSSTITASGGGNQQTATVRLLVGGDRVYIPLVVHKP